MVSRPYIINHQHNKLGNAVLFLGRNMGEEAERAHAYFIDTLSDPAKLLFAVRCAPTHLALSFWLAGCSSTSIRRYAPINHLSLGWYICICEYNTR